MHTDHPEGPLSHTHEQSDLLERNFLRRHCVSVGYVQGEDVVRLGSGVLVEIAGLLFVASAGHVIAEAGPDDIWIVPGEQLVTASTKPSVKWFGGTSGTDDDRIDLAGIEIVPTSVTVFDSKVPLHLDDLLLDPLEGNDEDVILFGNPVALIDRSLLSRKRVPLEGLSYKCRTCSIDEIPPQLNRNDHLAVKYELKSSYNIQRRQEVVLPHPQGISGGPLFRSGWTKGSVLWQPTRCKLMGIEHTWLSSRGMLAFTRIGRWLNFLKDARPDLKSEIEREVQQSVHTDNQ